MSAALVDELNLDAWFRPELDRRLLKRLSARSDARAYAHVAAYLGLLVAAGVCVILLWGSWWLLPPLLIYGNLWGLGCAALQHEVAHGTFFKSRRANTVTAHVTGWMRGTEATRFRWSHYVHHSNTLWTDDPYDYENATPMPINRRAFYFAMVPLGGLIVGPLRAGYFQWEIALHAMGRLTPVILNCVPKSEHRRVIVAARIHVLIYLLIAAFALAIGSWVPILLLLLPMWYGSTLLMVVALTQHAGLRTDIADHRLNTRSFKAGPILSFLYFHMEHHIEHHIFPQVPAYHLRDLSEAIKGEMPTPARGLVGCYREIVPALNRQARDSSYYIDVQIPAPRGGTIATSPAAVS